MTLYEWYGVFCFVFRGEDTFIWLAQNYDPILVQWDQGKRKNQLNKIPKKDSEYMSSFGIKTDDRFYYRQARQSLKQSFYFSLVIAFIAMGIGFYFGKIHPKYPFNLSKTITYSGVFLMLWSSLYDRYCVNERIHQLQKRFYKIIHAFLSIIIFCIGALTSFTGVILG